MSERIKRFEAVLEMFITFPDVDKWKGEGHYEFSSSQDSDGYYGYVSYRGNNVARIVLPPPGTQGKRVIIVRTCGWSTPSTTRTLNAALKAVGNGYHVNIVKGVVTLSDGRIVPDHEWLTV